MNSVTGPESAPGGRQGLAGSRGTHAKTALITGVSGQDGAYLSKLLLDKNYTVYGAVRRTSTASLHRLDELGIRSAVRLVDFDLMEPGTSSM